MQDFGTRESPTTFFRGGRLSGTGSVEFPEGMKNVELEGEKLCSTWPSDSYVDNVLSWKRPLYSQRGDPVRVVASRRSTSVRSSGVAGRSRCNGGSL